SDLTIPSAPAASPTTTVSASSTTPPGDYTLSVSQGGGGALNSIPITIVATGTGNCGTSWGSGGGGTPPSSAVCVPKGPMALLRAIQKQSGENVLGWWWLEQKWNRDPEAEKELNDLAADPSILGAVTWAQVINYLWSNGGAPPPDVSRNVTGVNFYKDGKVYWVDPTWTGPYPDFITDPGMKSLLIPTICGAAIPPPTK
ncbi:MAG: hypothetical protein ABI747_03415, partial [Candidatus Moraniibacteriota bacterium]